MTVARRPVLKALLICVLGGCSAPEAVSQDEILRVLQRMEEEMQDSVRGSLSSVLPAYRIKFSNFSSWLMVRMDEEEKLLQFGASAAPQVSRLVANPGTGWEMRARLSIVLGHLGDRRFSPLLLEVARSDEREIVRESAWIGLGLLKSLDLPAGLGKGTVRERWGLLWATAMGGSAAAREQYLNQIATTLADELLESPKTAEQSPLWVDEEQKHLALRAKVTEENKFLDLDLWKMAHFRDLRVVKILGDALAFHDPRVQRMAYELLERDVAGIPSTPSQFDFNLHSLKVHKKWKEWWSVNGGALRWDASRKKYVGN